MPWERKKYYAEMIGMVWGEWVVIGSSQKGGYVQCQCRCGVIRDVRVSTLKDGTSKSCGHINKKPIKVTKKEKVKKENIKKEKAKKGHKRADYTSLYGQRYGSWTVIGPSESGDYRFVQCRCKCGTVRDVRGNQLLMGRSTSCRCMASQKKHKNTASGYRNVYTKGDKFEVLARRKGKTYYIGLFDNINAAAKAAEEVSTMSYGEFFESEYSKSNKQPKPDQEKS